MLDIILDFVGELLGNIIPKKVWLILFALMVLAFGYFVIFK